MNRVILNTLRESAGSTEISASRMISSTLRGFRKIHFTGFAGSKDSRLPAVSRKVGKRKAESVGRVYTPFRGLYTPAPDASGIEL